MSLDVKGKTVVLTGTFARSRKELSDALEALGARVSGSVSKKTDYLFAGEAAGSKLADAKRYDVKILSEQELEQLLVSAGGKSSGAVDEKGSKRKRPAPPVTVAAGPFADWAALPGAASLEDAARSLLDAPWANFVAVRDFPPLAALLRRLQAEKGVTATHKALGARLKEKGAELRHCGGHSTELVSVGISCDGRYLATGCWVGDDYNAGGTLQVWDVVAGRAVNALPIEGGVGWPDFRECVQWAPDGQTLGVAYNTNGVGRFDAFGATGTARATAWVTNGWSRPPGWRWGNDSVSAVIATWGEGSKIPAVVVKLDRGEVSDRDAKWFRAPLPEELAGKELSIGYGATVYWSAEDLLLLASNHGTLAVDAKTGHVRWVAKLDGASYLTPKRDELFVLNDAGISWYSTATGKRVEEVRKAPLQAPVAFAGLGAPQRYVALGRWKKPCVCLYERAEELRRYEVAPKAAHYSQPDLRSFAIALDGAHVGVLDEHKRLHIFTAESSKALHVLEGLEEVAGLFFGAEGVLAAVGANRIYFVDYLRGAVLSQHELVLEAPGEGPLEHEGKSYAGYFTPGSTFALEEGGAKAWAMAERSGLVLCPSSHRARLPEQLSWVLERRFSFPLEWCDYELYESLFELRDKSKNPLAARLAKALPKGSAPAKRKAARAWPPEERGTLQELFQCLLASFGALHSGWQLHTSEYLRRAAISAARLGERALVDACLERIHEDYHWERLVAAARCAALFAKSDEAYARSLLARAEEEEKKLRDDYPWPRYAGSLALGAAYRALGDRARAKKAFEAARPLEAKENNSGQNVSELASALALGGDLDAAAQCYVDRVNPTGGWTFQTAAFGSILADGGGAVWRAMVRRAKETKQVFRETNMLQYLVNELYRTGEFELLLDTMASIEGVWLLGIRCDALVAMAAAGKRDAAFTRCLTLLEEHKNIENEWGPLLDALSKVDPERAEPVVREHAAKVNFATHSSPQLVGALARVGAVEEALRALGHFKGSRRALGAAAALHARPSDTALAQRLLAEPVPAPTSSDDFAAVATLAAAARAVGHPERATELVALAFDTPFEGGNKRFLHEDALRTLSQLGDLADAHAALGRFTKANRTRMAREPALQAARLGHFRAAIELLEAMDPGDLNNRGQAAFQCFMSAAEVRRCGPQARWNW